MKTRVMPAYLNRSTRVRPPTYIRSAALKPVSRTVVSVVTSVLTIAGTPLTVAGIPLTLTGES